MFFAEQVILRIFYTKKVHIPKELHFFNSIDQYSNLLHDSLHNRPVSDLDLLHTDFLLFIKVKTNHIPFVFTIIIKILRQLPLASLIVLISTPDLHLYDKLLAVEIHDHVGTSQIPCLCLNVVIANTINDRPQIQQKKLAPLSSTNSALF